MTSTSDPMAIIGLALVIYLLWLWFEVQRLSDAVEIILARLGKPKEPVAQDVDLLGDTKDVEIQKD